MLQFSVTCNVFPQLGEKAALVQMLASKSENAKSGKMTVH